MLHQLLLSFYPLYIVDMVEPHGHYMDHHQKPNNRYCVVVYHCRVIDWCYQFWTLLSTWTPWTLHLNGILWAYGLYFPPIMICILTLLKLIECRSITICQLHLMLLATNMTDLTIYFHHKSCTTGTIRTVRTESIFVYISLPLHKRFFHVYKSGLRQKWISDLWCRRTGVLVWIISFWEFRLTSTIADSARFCHREWGLVKVW